MYTAIQVADWFRSAVDREAGDVITHLKLQKLVYYAQAWALALLDRPLFEEDIRAAHGPVVPSVWHAFKEYGFDPLPPVEEVVEFDGDTEELLNDVLSAYGEHSAKKLEELTHSESPWLRARAGAPPETKLTTVIPKDHMKGYYREFYDTIE